jgi:hypothetical protein
MAEARVTMNSAACGVPIDREQVIVWSPPPVSAAASAIPILTDIVPPLLRCHELGTLRFGQPFEPRIPQGKIYVGCA